MIEELVTFLLKLVDCCASVDVVFDDSDSAFHGWLSLYDFLESCD